MEKLNEKQIALQLEQILHPQHFTTHNPPRMKKSASVFVQYQFEQSVSHSKEIKLNFINGVFSLRDVKEIIASLQNIESEYENSKRKVG